MTPEIPHPKGDPVRITTFVDVYHSYYLRTRRSDTGVLVFLNKPPIQWHSRQHNTMETSTYGSELLAIIIATTLTIAMHYNLIIIRVPINGTY